MRGRLAVQVGCLSRSDEFTRKSPLWAAEDEAEDTTPEAPKALEAPEAPVRGRLAVLVGVVATAKRPANRGRLTLTLCSVADQVQV